MLIPFLISAALLWGFCGLILAISAHSRIGNLQDAARKEAIFRSGQYTKLLETMAEMATFLPGAMPLDPAKEKTSDAQDESEFYGSMDDAFNRAHKVGPAPRKGIRKGKR